MIKITTDLVSPRSLSETVRNDIYTEIWMHYACLSPNIRKPLSAGSPKAQTFYQSYDRYSVLLALTLGAGITYGTLFYRSHAPLLLAAGIIAIAAFLWIKIRQKKLIVELSKEIIPILWADETPKGTLFQFGEELARRYNLTSFIDFNGKLDSLLKRGFCSILLLAILIYVHTNWLLFVSILALYLCWPFLLGPRRILSTVLRLK